MRHTITLLLSRFVVILSGKYFYDKEGELK